SFFRTTRIAIADPGDMDDWIRRSVFSGIAERRGGNRARPSTVETRNPMFRASRRRTGVADRRRARHRRRVLAPEVLERRSLLSTYFVDNTADSGAGSLRQAIINANSDPSPGTDNIDFDIPTSTAPLLNVPVSGFDPNTQTWEITLNSPLPVITRSVWI